MNDTQPILKKLAGRSNVRVAVFRALQLGDLLVTIPALRALRKALPQAEITLVSLPWAAQFVQRWNCYVDQFLEFPGYPGLPERDVDLAGVPRFFAEAQSRRFDLAVQLHGSGSYVNSITVLLGAARNAGFFVPGEYCPDAETFMPWPKVGTEVDRNLDLMLWLGAPHAGNHLDLPLTQRDLDDLASVDELRDLEPGTYACLHAGSRLLSRRWRPERFAAVADALLERGLRVVLTGSRDELELTRRLSEMIRGPHLNVAGKTTFGAMAALLSRTRLLVSNDTGASHIAAAVRTPSAVVVTGSDPSRWAPHDTHRHRTMLHAVDCRPCAHFECPIGQPCADGVTVEAVVSEIDRLLSDYPASLPPRSAAANQPEILCADFAS